MMDEIIERGVRISRTTLSDRTSRLRPRLVVSKPSSILSGRGLEPYQNVSRETFLSDWGLKSR